MKSHVENLSQLGRKINIEVPAAVVQGAFEKIFKNIQREVAVKGFRKGKAPLNTIKSLYLDKVKQDVAQELIQSHYPQALSEHKLDPINYPEIDFDEPRESENFSFSASFDVRPNVDLKNYESLEVEKEKFEFSEAQVDKVLENIRASRSQQEPVLELRPAQMNDIAVIDFEGFVDGKALEGGTGTDHNLELGAKQFIEGFEEGIIGMNIGDQKTLNLQFPTPYHSEALAGKPVEFKVQLKGLKKKVLPELTEEFLATLGGPSDLESLKKSIREDLERSEKKRIEDAFKNRLLKKLVAANPLPVPASLQKEQKQSLIEDFKKRMKDQGLSEAEFTDYAQKWDEDFNKTAEEMIQSSFLIDAIARKHDLICKKEDVDQRFQEYAQQTGIEESRIREYYSQSEQFNRLTYTITEEKVVKFLTATAKIKEVSAESLQDRN